MTSRRSFLTTISAGSAGAWLARLTRNVLPEASATPDPASEHIAPWLFYDSFDVEAAAGEPHAPFAAQLFQNWYISENHPGARYHLCGLHINIESHTQRWTKALGNDLNRVIAHADLSFYCGSEAIIKSYPLCWFSYAFTPLHPGPPNVAGTAIIGPGAMQNVIPAFRFHTGQHLHADLHGVRRPVNPARIYVAMEGSIHIPKEKQKT